MNWSLEQKNCNNLNSFSLCKTFVTTVLILENFTCVVIIVVFDVCLRCTHYLCILLF